MVQGVEKAELDFLQSQAEFPVTVLGRCSASPGLGSFSSASGWNEAEDGIPAGGFSLVLFAGPPVSEQQVSPCIWAGAMNGSGKCWVPSLGPSSPKLNPNAQYSLQKGILPREAAALGGFHGRAIFFHFKGWVAELKKQNKTEKSFLSPGIFATSLLHNKCTFPSGLKALLSCLGRGAIHSRFTGEGRSHTLSFHSHVVPNQEPPQDTI